MGNVSKDAQSDLMNAWNARPTIMFDVFNKDNLYKTTVKGAVYRIFNDQGKHVKVRETENQPVSADFLGPELKPSADADADDSWAVAKTSPEMEEKQDELIVLQVRNKKAQPNQHRRVASAPGATASRHFAKKSPAPEKM